MPVVQVQMKELVSHQGFPMYLLMILRLSKSLESHYRGDDDEVNIEDKEEEGFHIDPRVHTPSNDDEERMNNTRWKVEAKRWMKRTSTDSAKITRKRTKPDKHEHGNRKSAKEPEDCYQWST
ncbi:hypothetical protein Tco_1137505 [Tanacetum coccineum]